MEFRLGCKLGYAVNTADTPFVFDIEAQTFENQRVLAESLVIDPPLATDTWTMPESGNRYFRLKAPTGRLFVSYEATVDLTVRTVALAAITQILPGDLPLSVFTHLYPCRYCQSDKLERFAP